MLRMYTLVQCTVYSLPWTPTTVPSSPLMNRSDACEIYDIRWYWNAIAGTGMEFRNSDTIITEHTHIYHKIQWW